jgi:basic membrane protein A
MAYPRQPRFSRRQVVRGLMATTAFGVVTKLSAACSPSADTGDTTAADGGGGGGEETMVGFIYVGPKDDFGYNQAHAEGGSGHGRQCGGHSNCGRSQRP